MSETFRNTTFLIAIRDSGFVCNELLRVYGGVNDSTTWTATCSEMLAYTVSVASTGALHVEPMLQHLDQVGPAVTPTRARRRPRCCGRSACRRSACRRSAASADGSERVEHGHDGVRCLAPAP